jgi:hypothetical protein
MLDLLQQLLFCLCFTPLVLLWGGCCCEPGCEFFSDDFTRADSDTIGNGWTEEAGDGDIVGNKLSTASSNAVFVQDAEHPDGAPNVKVSMTVNIATSGDTARIYLDRVDANNYWFAEVKAGSGAYIRIYQVSGGGSPTQKASRNITQSTSQDFTFCASIQDGVTILASRTNVSTTDSVAFGDEEGPFSSPQIAIGTGSVSGTVVFDDVEISVTSEDCPACQHAVVSCGTCIDGNAPRQYEVTFSGLTNGSCSDCSFLNGTFVLDNDGSGATLCTWRYNLPASFCGTSKWIGLNINSTLGVVGVYIGPDGTSQFEQTMSFPIDCENLGSVTSANYSGHCNSTGATCTISAIF